MNKIENTKKTNGEKTMNKIENTKNQNGEMKMTAREMTLYGIIFLILSVLAQEFLTKISEPILNWSDCKTSESKLLIRGTTVLYIVSIVFLLFPRVLRLIHWWKFRKNGEN